LATLNKLLRGGDFAVIVTADTRRATPKN